MVEAVFEQSYHVASRLAAVRSAAMVTLYGLPQDSRLDLEQEALLELWRKRTAYDPARGSWRTFAERVVANRMGVPHAEYAFGQGRQLQRDAPR